MAMEYCGTEDHRKYNYTHSRASGYKRKDTLDVYVCIWGGMKQMFPEADVMHMSDAGLLQMNTEALSVSKGRSLGSPK